jgi:hypothetical protein
MSLMGQVSDLEPSLPSCLLFKVSTLNFKYVFLIITHMLCDKVNNYSVTIFRIIPTLNLKFMLIKLMFLFLL